MAAVLLATTLRPAFLSPWPHRKRKWRRRHRDRITIPPQSRNAGFSPHSGPCGIEIRKHVALDGVEFSTGAGLRCSGRAFVGWTSSRMRLGYGGIDGVFLKPRRFVMSAALPGINLALVAAEFDMQSPVESASASAPFVGESLLNALGQFLVNSVLDPYVQVATFILLVVVLVSLVEDGGRRGKEKSALEIVSCSSPFNLFVTKRCPSISSLEAFLRFRRKEAIGGDESRPVYQRKCLFSGDGGVVAIDWPSQLELTGEDGFDNILLLVPGTTEGSRDVGVEKFVMDAMRLGYVPVVLNPRGCAGSPLITPRVFTAADSDDVRLVIQHIMSAQPRATVMGVGWGFGANMLSKYLGEEGRSAPLMAAVCISNSFDLQETSKHLSSTNGGKFDRAMADGLVRILEANKMLFVGEKKGYDLNKALAATSVCEFEAAISRVACGFKTLADFYAAASSINNISTVQTPLLFIQGEDVAVPVSIPRQTIKANPFTTAIVAQFPTTTFIPNEKTVKEPGSASRHDWSHTIALEWLAAVELALLKGRHPCLDTISLRSEVENNINISSNLPSHGQTEDKKRVSSNDKVKSLKLMTEQPTGDGGQEYNEEVAPRPKVNDDAMGQEKGGLVADGSEYGPVPKSGNSCEDNVNEDESAISDEINGTRVINDAVGQENSELVDGGAENGIVSKAGDTEGKKTDEFDASANSEKQNGAPEDAAAPEEEAPPEEGEPEEGSEAFQMRMAAESIMNVLDITMPGTLSDEKKTEVLTAVGKGETIVTALQEAVPEEVRGSMAAAVSGAVQARGLSFNLVGFGKNMPPPSLPAGLISSIKGRLETVSGGNKETVPVPSPSPVSESPPPGTGEPQKQKQDGHEIGNSNSGDHSKESGSSENSKTEDHKAEEHGSLDPQNSKATPSGGASDQGDAHPETSDSKTEKNDDSGEDRSVDSGVLQGAKAKSSEEVEEKDKPNKEKDRSEKEKASPDGATNDPSNPTEEMAKDLKGELNDLEESTEGKQVGGKNEESTGRKEEADNKGVESKDHHGQEEHIDDKQPVNSKDSNEQVVKEETKPEGAKENNPESVKEETKPEGDNVSTPGTPAPVTAVSTPAPAPSASPPASDPIPPEAGMGPPIDMRMAFEALTGFDDSTQMAVTNVFGVVESMLEQMEKDQKTAGPDSPNGSKDATNDYKKENDEEKSDGENVKRDKVQKLTGSDSSDDSKRTTAEHENENDKEEIGQGKERRDKQQKASEPSSPAPELPDDYENGSNEDESGGAKGTQFKSKSTHNEEDGDAVPAESLDKKLENFDDGNNSQAKKNKSAGRLAVKVFETDELDSVQRPFSKVLTTRRAGSSIFVTSVLNFEVPQMTNGVHAGQNGAASGFAATSRDLNGALPREGFTNGAGPQVQRLMRTNSLSSDVKVTKAVPVNMTMDQLLVDMDRENHEDPDKEKETRGIGTIEVEATGIKETESPNMVENMIADALKLEVLRRLGVAGIEALGIDLEKEVAKVADAVAETVRKWKQVPGNDRSESGKLGILESDSIVSTLGSVVSGTSILGGLVPIGVLAGVVLASLGAVYLIVTDHQESKKSNVEAEVDGDDEIANEEEARSEGSLWHEAKESALDVPVLSVNVHAQEDIDEPVESSSDFCENEKQGSVDTDDPTDDENDESNDPAELSSEDQTEGNNKKLMGVMAAAVSGGATLAGMSMANNGTATNDQDNELTSNEATGTGQKNPSIISSFHPLAEKALSVAAPVVPTNEDGEIDHERLVAMLAELGQRGGFFRLIGKVALLWGGLRGAMSLTERLIVFLRINERPLQLRLVGFAAMIVLLWSPVLVPVLPSLLQKWATKSPSGVADAASVVGLYGAILILITIWGKRVRGYSKPLLSYGLRLYSWRKLRDLISGLALGCVSVTALYTANAFLGYLQCDWKALLATNTKLFPRLLPGAVGVTIFTIMKIFRLLGQAVGIGLAISLVEEVLFRSWLQEEIAVDLGFHRAVFLSALAFALIHWSPAAMPGLWFLAVALAGARAKTGRNLAFPIGLHAGLVAANYVVNVGGVAKFLPHAPTWFTGAHVGNPLAGALGTAMTAMLAVILYPRTAINPPAVTAPIDSAKEVGA